MNSVIEPYGYYADQTFQAAHLEGTQVEAAEFHDCKFSHCSFAEAILSNCRFNHCTFANCDLSLAQLPGTVFAATRFEGSKLIGIDWTKADWSGPRLGDPIGFYKSALSHATFIGLPLKGIQIVDCLAVEADFREADLAQANFAGTDLSRSLFFSTNLTEADFREARNYHIAPGKNTLTGAKFSMPEALALLHSLDIILEDMD